MKKSKKRLIFLHKNKYHLIKNKEKNYIDFEKEKHAINNMMFENKTQEQLYQKLNLVKKKIKIVFV